MVQTPASSSTTYCPVARFLERIDQRTVAQIASDGGEPVPIGSLSTNANVLAALKDASGLVESAAFRGEKYATADLAALAATDTVGRGLLYRIVADLAVAFLWERRPNKSDGAQPPASLQRSLQWLDDLAQGVRIFPMLEAMEAGRTETRVETREDVEDRDGMTFQAARFFGTRANRGGR